MGRVTGSRRRLPILDTVSAGGVVWRASEGGIEVVVCGRLDGLRMLPKGTPNAGEAIEQTALREVREETGLAVALGDSLGSIAYWFTSGGVRYHKQVHHWLMQPTGGSLDDHDHEFDIVEWMRIDAAYRVLSYVNEKRILAAVAAKFGVPV